MTGHRRAGLVCALFACFLFVSSAVFGADELETRRNACTAHVQQLKAERDGARTRTMVLGIIGAVVAGLGSLGALFSESTNKKIAAGLGCVGAIVAGVTQALPNGNEQADLFKNSALHQRLGEIVQAQIEKGMVSEKTGTQYAIARFTDCASERPSDAPPPPPDGFSRAGKDE